MSASSSPLHFLLFTFAGWINQHQQTVIEYLQEENRVLKEQLRGRRLLILDRDRKYTEGFRKMLEDAGMEMVRLPVRSPNLNAYAERIVLSFKSECLDRMVLFGEASLKRAVSPYLVHYHGKRNQQGLGNRLIEPAASVGEKRGKVECRERLGGMLKYSYRDAA